MAITIKEFVGYNLEKEVQPMACATKKKATKKKATKKTGKKK